MSLSKPLYNILAKYFEQLFNHPIRTKSITACILASSANLVSQNIAGQKNINLNSLLAYGLFGLTFGGTIPHYFYLIIENALRKDLRLRKYIIFFCERLCLAPTFAVLSLYFLSRFEGYDHSAAAHKMQSFILPTIKANWMYLSLPVFLNIYFVPPMLRVFVANLIAFGWIVYLSKKRSKKENK